MESISIIINGANSAIGPGVVYISNPNRESFNYEKWNSNSENIKNTWNKCRWASNLIYRDELFNYGIECGYESITAYREVPIDIIDYSGFSTATNKYLYRLLDIFFLRTGKNPKDICFIKSHPANVFERAEWNYTIPSSNCRELKNRQEFPFKYPLHFMALLNAYKIHHTFLKPYDLIYPYLDIGKNFAHVNSKVIKKFIKEHGPGYGIRNSIIQNFHVNKFIDWRKDTTPTIEDITYIPRIKSPKDLYGHI